MDIMNSLKVKLMNEEKAAAALVLMQNAIDNAEIATTTHFHLSLFAVNLMQDGSEIYATESCLNRESFEALLPIVFSALANADAASEFNAEASWGDSYDFNEYEINYAFGKLTINSRFFCADDEPSCSECGEFLEYFEEDGVEGYRCTECGTVITLEEYESACITEKTAVYEIC